MGGHFLSGFKPVIFTTVRDEEQEQVRSITPMGITIDAGQRVQVFYLGNEYTGTVTDYYITNGGDYALGVQLEVEAGHEIKYFLNRKKPVIILL